MIATFGRIWLCMLLGKNDRPWRFLSGLDVSILVSNFDRFWKFKNVSKCENTVKFDLRCQFEHLKTIWHLKMHLEFFETSNCRLFFFQIFFTKYGGRFCEVFCTFWQSVKKYSENEIFVYVTVATFDFDIKFRPIFKFEKLHVV